MIRFWLCLGVCLLAAGCGDSGVAVAPQPREPDSHAIGYYCRMMLTEHAGPKGQIVLKGAPDPLWFSSVRDAFTYVSQDLTSERDMAAFWVNDMAQGSWERPAPGSWIVASTALYVVGSSKTASMGGVEAVPFKDREQADGFVREFGGHVVDYRGARAELSQASEAGPNDGGTQ
jgi:copper chaperone NosL